MHIIEFFFYKCLCNTHKNLLTHVYLVAVKGAGIDDMYSSDEDDGGQNNGKNNMNYIQRQQEPQPQQQQMQSFNNQIQLPDYSTSEFKVSIYYPFFYCMKLLFYQNVLLWVKIENSVE